MKCQMSKISKERHKNWEAVKIINVSCEEDRLTAPRKLNIQFKHFNQSKFHTFSPLLQTGITSIISSSCAHQAAFLTCSHSLSIRASKPRMVLLLGSKMIWAREVTWSVESVPSVPWINMDAPSLIGKSRVQMGYPQHGQPTLLQQTFIEYSISNSCILLRPVGFRVEIRHTKRASLRKQNKTKQNYEFQISHGKNLFKLQQPSQNILVQFFLL